MKNTKTSQLFIYSIKDLTIGMFLPPFLAPSDDEAKRIVAESVEPGSIAARFPADYHLVRCGVFDSGIGLSRDPEDNVSDVLCSLTDIVKPAIIAETIAQEVHHE